MGRYFADIRRGRELNDALTAYTTYLTSPRVRRLNTRGDRAPSILVYVEPYSLVMGASEIAAVNANRAAFEILKTYLVTANDAEVVNTTAADPTSINGFKPAKVTWSRAVSKSKSTPNSRFTGRPYLKYNNVENLSCPFGRAKDTDRYRNAAIKIKAALKAVAGFEVNRVSFREEDFTD